MVETSLYLPESQSKVPVVIGAPGFLHKSEWGRIDCFLEKLCKEHGIAGIRINFSGIVREDKKITCNFNLEQYLKDIHTVIDYINNGSKFDQNRIGFIASSISAGIFGHYLAQCPKYDGSSRVLDARGSVGPRHHANFACCALISPLPGWRSYATEKIREIIEQAGKGLPLTQPRDKERGITRLIPQDSFAEAKKMDAISSLQGYRNKGMVVMTLIGRQDSVANVEDMHLYHEILGGRKENRLEYDCGHDIPHELSKTKIIEFLSRALTRNA